MGNKKNEIHVVDMFCGGGGESTGLFSAAEKIGFKIKLSAINHWERAIETHAANYPSAEHFCESVEHLDPTKVVSSGKLDLLWASPECTHHSKARGGRPKYDLVQAAPEGYAEAGGICCGTCKYGKRGECFFCHKDYREDVVVEESGMCFSYENGGEQC